MIMSERLTTPNKMKGKFWKVIGLTYTWRFWAQRVFSR